VSRGCAIDASRASSATTTWLRAATVLTLERYPQATLAAMVEAQVALTDMPLWRIHKVVAMRTGETFDKVASAHRRWGPRVALKARELANDEDYHDSAGEERSNDRRQWQRRGE